MADRSVIRRNINVPRVRSLPTLTSGSPFDGGHGTKVRKARVRRLKSKVTGFRR